MPHAGDKEATVDEPETIEALRAAIAAQRSRNAATEQAIKETAEHLEILQEAITAVPGIVWISESTPHDARPRITFLGGQIERILGRTPKELVDNAEVWTKTLHPDDAERVTARLSSSGSPGAPADEYRAVHKDGRVVWVEPRRRVLRDAEGKPIGWCGVVLDVTARKVIEQQRAALLERSQKLSQRLDKLIASVPGVVWEARTSPETGDAVLTFIGDHITKITGYLPEECVGDPAFWQRVVHPEEQERVAREAMQLVDKDVGIFQLRWLTKDHRTIWVEQYQRVLRDERGVPIGAYGLTMDITAQKLAEDERARQKEEMIRAQAATLEQLSTPLIPISAEVMVMPLIGAVDQARAARVIEALLEGINRARARFAIIDITGVPTVDATTADTLVRAARAVELLGARVVLTGIRPEVAQTLVALGVELGGITTCGNLERGIAHATRRR